MCPFDEYKPNKKESEIMDKAAEHLEEAVKNIVSIEQEKQGNNKPDEPTPIETAIYAKLYQDGTLILSSNGSIDNTKGECIDYGDISKSQSERPPWNDKMVEIKNVKVNDKIMPTSTAYWFYNGSNIESIDLEKMDTSNVTTMSGMFNGCSSLTNIYVTAATADKIKGEVPSNCNIIIK